MTIRQAFPTNGFWQRVCIKVSVSAPPVTRREAPDKEKEKQQERERRPFMNFNNFTIKSQEAVQEAVNLVQNRGLIDRYGNESLPTQQKQSDKSAITDKFIKNDGKKLLLPDKGKTLDSEYVIVKSLAGNIISIHPYKGKYADISNLENGCYILLSLNKKDIAHRLGYFMIKR